MKRTHYVGTYGKRYYKNAIDTALHETPEREFQTGGARRGRLRQPDLEKHVHVGCSPRSNCS